MSIDRLNAAKALQDVDEISRRTRVMLFHHRFSASIIWWGILSTVGYVLSYENFHLAKSIWILIHAAGFLGTCVLLGASEKARGRYVCDSRIMLSLVCLVVIGYIITTAITHPTPRQIGAFWPVYAMAAYLILGVWFDRVLLFIASMIIAATIGAFYMSGEYFELVMAATNGFGLVAGGMWMRSV